MNLLTILTIVFFFTIGLSVFYPARGLAITYGIAAILIAILMVVGVNPTV